MTDETKRTGRPARSDAPSTQTIRLRMTPAEVEELDRLGAALGTPTRSDTIREGLKLLAGNISSVCNWIIAEGVPAADALLTARTDLGPVIKAGDVLALDGSPAHTSAGAICAATVDGDSVVGPVYPGEGDAMTLYPYGIGSAVPLTPDNYLGCVTGLFRALLRTPQRDAETTEP